MSSVIEFPGKEPPPEGYSKEHVDKLHAEAFRDLEGEVCDLDRMGQIAQDLIMNCVANKESFHDLELASFAVSQLAKMAKEFRTNYEKRWVRRTEAMSELTPKHALVDLFGSGDFPAEIIDPEHAAEIVIQRLNDAGFKIVPAGT